MMESTARKVFGENGDPIGKRMVLTKKLMSSPDATTSSGGTVYNLRSEYLAETRINFDS